MNGAAAIALLAFMGANAGKEDPLVEVSIELFKFALMCVLEVVRRSAP
jgi:hypothetical protein